MNYFFLRKIQIFVLLSGVLLFPAACSDSQGRDTSAGGLSRDGGRGGSAGWAGRGGATDVESVSIKAFKALRRPISSYILANTSIESIRKVSIYARVSAIVKELLVEEGSPVRRDQVLARLDDREIRNEYLQARIALEQAESALKQAEVRAELSRANYERSLSLLEQKLISQQEYDQAVLNNRTDSLAFEVATQQTSAARARLEAAQIQLDYTEIRSSIGGVVTQRLIEVGSRVNVNQEVFVVEEYPPLWARIFVPEKELTQLRVGQQATLKVQAFPEEEFGAGVHMINPTVDPESGTVKVTLQLNNPRRMLRPGMFGTVYIATETHPNAVVIPKKAVLRERDEDRVFVVRADSTVEKRAVQLGFGQESDVEVLSGIEEGEVVVTVGQEGLNDNYPVNILDWDGAPAEMPSGDFAGTRSPEEAQVQKDLSPAGRQPGQWGSGPGGGSGAPPNPERLKVFLERMLADPEVKAAYEQRLKENPGLSENPEELRDFLREMRQKTGRGRP